MASIDVDSARDTIDDARSHVVVAFFFVVKLFVFGPLFTFLLWYPFFIFRAVTYPAINTILLGMSGDRWHLPAALVRWAIGA